MVIKSRTTSITILDQQGNIICKYTSLIQKFNKSALPVFEKAFHANNDIQHKTLYKYNRKGQLIEKTVFEADDRLIIRVDCFYDEHRLIQTEITTVDESKVIKEHDVDKTENFEKVVINSEHGEILGYEVRWFDKRNQVVAEIRSNADQQVMYKRFATYDHEGRLLLEEFFGKNEQLQKRVVYNYAFHGKLSQIITQYEDEPYGLTEHFRYDQQQRLTETSLMDERKGIQTKTLYHYGAKGHQVTVATYEQEQLLHKSSMHYDAEGNLIEEEVVSRGKPYFHEIRRYEIAYW